MRPDIHVDKRYLLPMLFIIGIWFSVAGASAWKNGAASDIVRQWVVCRYILAGQNPFALSKEILEARYGPIERSKAKVFTILPRDVPAELSARMLTDYGPPQAGYPPSAVGLLCLVVGLLPSQEAVLAIWLGVTLLALVAVGVLLHRLLPASPLPWQRASFVSLIALMLLFSPFFTTVTAGQFSLVVLASLLIGCRRETSETTAGVALAIAMIKPSIAIPFLVIPLIQGRWKRLLLMASIHGLAMAGVCLAVGASPRSLLRDWLAVSRYFLQGLYSIQEIINQMDWRAYGIWVSGLTLLLGSLVTLIGRQAPAAYHIAYTGAASMFWTYHGPYDFVCLLPALMLLMGFAEDKNAPGSARGSRAQAVWQASRVRSQGWLRLIGPCCFTVLSLAMMPVIIEGDFSVARILRWSGRAAFLTVLFLMGVLLWRQSKSTSLVTARRAGH